MTDLEVEEILLELGAKLSSMLPRRQQACLRAVEMLRAIKAENAQMANELADMVEDSDRLRHIRDEAHKAGRMEMRAEAIRRVLADDWPTAAAIVAALPDVPSTAEGGAG